MVRVRMPGPERQQWGGLSTFTPAVWFHESTWWATELEGPLILPSTALRIYSVQRVGEVAAELLQWLQEKRSY